MIIVNKFMRITQIYAINEYSLLDAIKKRISI